MMAGASLLFLFAAGITGSLAAGPVFESCPEPVARAVTLYPLPGAKEAEFSYHVKVTDAEDGVIIDAPFSAMYPIGVNPISPTYYDTDGLSVSCPMVVTVVDNQNPTITCPTGVLEYITALPDLYSFSFSCAQDVMDAASASVNPCKVTAWDNSETVSLSQLDSTSSLGLGDHVIRFEATDPSENTATCAVNVKIIINSEILAAQNADAAARQKGNAVNALLDIAISDSSVNQISAVIDTLTAEDDVFIQGLSKTIGAFASNGEGQISTDSQLSLMSSSSKLMGLRKQQSDNRKANSASKCTGCSTCTSDCASTNKEDGVTGIATLSVAQQWFPLPAGFGPSLVTASVDVTSTGPADVTVTSLSKTELTVADPSTSLPQSYNFAGVVIQITHSDPDALFDSVSVSVDVSEIGHYATKLTWIAFDSANNEWAKDCNDTSSSVDVGTSRVFTANLCNHGKMFALATTESVDGTETFLAGSAASFLSYGSASATDEKTVNDKAVDLLKEIGSVVGAELTSNSGPAVLKVGNVTLQTSPANASDLSTFGATTQSSDGTALSVSLPSDVGIPTGAASVGVSNIIFEGDSNPYTYNNATDAIKSAIVDLSILADGTEVNVSGLVEPITFTLTMGYRKEGEKRVCSFWDDTLVNPSCNPADKSPACIGGWSTDGVTTVEDDVGKDYIMCATTHLSSYGGSIDFTISGPDISASNFDPSNSWIIWVTYGSLMGLVLIVAFYSWVERKRYDSRQVKIERGEIEDDEIVESPTKVDAAPTEGWKRFFLVRMMCHFCTRLKSQHAWIAMFWPNGRNVFPKRTMKVLALAASISLAAGLDAIFAYTAIDHAVAGESKTVNTMTLHTIWGSATIPMDGIYSLLLALPALLVLSLTLGTYSAYTDVLRKVAPRRFRAMNPEVKQIMLQRGIEVDVLTKKRRKALRRKARDGIKEQKQAKKAQKKAEKLAQKKLGRGSSQIPLTVQAAWGGEEGEYIDVTGGRNDGAMCRNDSLTGQWNTANTGFNRENSLLEERPASVNSETNAAFAAILGTAGSLMGKDNEEEPMFGFGADATKETQLVKEEEEAFRRASSLLADVEDSIGGGTALHHTDSLTRPSKGTALTHGDSLTRPTNNAGTATAFSADSLMRPAKTKALTREDSLSSQIQGITRRNSIIDDESDSDGHSDAESVADSLLGDSDDEPEPVKDPYKLLAENEFSEDIEKLVLKMYYWKRVAAGVSFVLILGGMMMTFLWVGSLNESQQTRWLKSFIAFELMAILVAAPVFILIASALQARAEKKKLEEQEEERLNRKKAKKEVKSAAKGDLKDDINDEIKTVLAQELAGNLMSMNFF